MSAGTAQKPTERSAHRPPDAAAPRAPERTAARDGNGPRPPAYQVLADELRQQILSGILRPGERLPTEPQLCARSRLSRSTVREALRLLASQQLIITTRGVTGGSFVAEPCVERLADSLAGAMQVLRAGARVSGEQFLEARELIEVAAAELAARRRTADDLAALRAALVDAEEPDVDAKLSLYWRFHAALTAAAHNPLFVLLARPLRQMSNDRELVLAGPPDLWQRAAADLRRLLRHVAAGQPADAAAAAREHLAYLRGIYRVAEVELIQRPSSAAW